MHKSKRRKNNKQTKTQKSVHYIGQAKKQLTTTNENKYDNKAKTTSNTEKQTRQLNTKTNQTKNQVKRIK